MYNLYFPQFCGFSTYPPKETHVDRPLIRPYFWGRYVREGRLISHKS